MFSDVPSAPVGPLSVSDLTESTCMLSWQPPTSDGGTPLTGYVLQFREGRRSWRNLEKLPADQTTYKATSLIVDNEYTFKVTAMNAEGESQPLTSDSVKPQKKLGMYFFMTKNNNKYSFFIYITMTTGCIVNVRWLIFEICLQYLIICTTLKLSLRMFFTFIIFEDSSLSSIILVF